MICLINHDRKVVYKLIGEDSLFLMKYVSGEPGGDRYLYRDWWMKFVKDTVGHTTELSNRRLWDLISAKWRAQVVDWPDSLECDGRFNGYPVAGTIIIRATRPGEIELSVNTCPLT